MKSFKRISAILLAVLLSFTTFFHMPPLAYAAVDVVGASSVNQGTFTAGEALDNGEVVYIKASDGEVYLADTDLGIPAYGIVKAGSGGSVANGALCVVVRKGRIIGESSLTVNGPVYLTATAGTYDQTGVSTYLQAIGVARNATTIDFDITATFNPAEGRTYMILSYADDNITTAEAAVAMKTAGSSTVTEFEVPWAGSITAVSIITNESRTAGSMIADPTINGTVIGLHATLNNTNADHHSTTQASGTDAFAAGDRVGIKFTSTTDWAPVTADHSVLVVFDAKP